MKKLISLSLVLIMVLGACAVAQAAPFYLESAGVTIEVPDGMSAEDASDEANACLAIGVDGRDDIGYSYTVTYIDEFEGKGMEDLSEEEGAQLAAGITAALDNPSAVPAEVNGYPVLCVANGEGTELHYIALLNGWMCDVAAVKTDGNSLEDADIQVAAQLVTSITFDTDSEEAAEEGAEEEAEAEVEEEAAE